MRVQRTRSLGLAIGLVIAVSIACDHKTPTEPMDGSLAGTWVAALVRSPCLGDWSSITVTLQQAGDSVSGTVKTKDAREFQISGTIVNGTGRLSVTLPMYSGDCPSMGFQVLSIRRDGSGRAVGFSSQALGRCCGTILEPVEFTRAAVA